MDIVGRSGERLWDGWSRDGRPVFDDRDEAIRQERIRDRLSLYDEKPGPLVGDFAILKDGRTVRFSYDWGDQLQVSERGSFYLWKGGAFDFSGSLEPPIAKARFIRETITADAPCWFFHHDDVRAHNGVHTTIPVHVWRETDQ